LTLDKDLGPVRAVAVALVVYPTFGHVKHSFANPLYSVKGFLFRLAKR
jgi:hypothetical protein